jgi:glycosyltransferase involved in cell wall biosynthesis
VPPLDPCALSKAFISLCEAGEQGRQKMGRLARARAETEYDLGSICSRYSALYSATVAKQRDPFRGLEAQETNQCAG